MRTESEVCRYQDLRLSVTMTSLDADAASILCDAEREILL